jgi:signal transduction histidine kinase
MEHAFYLLQSLALTEQSVLLVIGGTIFFLLLVSIIYLAIWRYIRKQKAHMLELQHLTLQYEKAILSSKQEIQEQTLKTVSQEIHDNIGQVLSLAKLNLSGLEQKNPGIDLTETRELIGKAIADLRDLSKSLHPERIAKQPLVESFLFELNRLEKTGMMKTQFEVSGEVFEMEEEKKVILYRVFQEVMNNAIKHSEATVFNVNMTFQQDVLGIVLSDDGHGFSENIQEGIGLSSIRTRMKLIQGMVDIESSNGTTIALTILK